MKARISDIFNMPENYIGNDIELSGWIRTLRCNNHFGFIELNDGSFLKPVQVVFESTIANFSKITRLNVGSAVRVRGRLVNSQGKGQDFEISSQDIIVESLAPPEFPLQKKRHGFEYLRSIAHLRSRTNVFNTLFRLRSIASYAIHTYFNIKGYIHVHTPIITTSDAEGGADVFAVDKMSKGFFSKQAYLTTTGQLHAEAFALSHKNVYTFGPTFRADNSNTTRHLSEFWMMEPELAFADLEDCIALIEDMLKYLIGYLLEFASEEMLFFDKYIESGLINRLRQVEMAKFDRVSYTKAIDILCNSGEKFENTVIWGNDLQTEHEKYLADKVFKKPVFITDYPKGVKSFYMRRNDDGKTVAATDLLVPAIGEIVGGSQREERYDILIKAMKEHGLNPVDYWWYLELCRYGSVKHAGFGLGFERFLMFVTGMTNIKDVIPFPRTAGTVDF